MKGVTEVNATIFFLTQNVLLLDSWSFVGSSHSLKSLSREEKERGHAHCFVHFEVTPTRAGRPDAL